jgi:uncharacterized protein (DUF2236 family)
MVWEVSKHGALFVGSWRAVLLQLAHPWVAQAIAQHSRTMQDPIGRFHGTFRTMFTMVYGDLSKVLGVANGLHRVHARIEGTLTEEGGRFASGSKYQANDVEAMFWVQATLWEGSVRFYELLVRPLNDAEKEQYYQESKLTARLFGIPDEVIPETWVDFIAYFEETLHSDLLGVGDVGREIGCFMFKLDRLFWAKPFLPRAKRLTAALLPEHLRAGFALPELNERARKGVARDIRLMRFVYRLLPKRIKYIPTYFEARCRIRGCKKLDRITRIGNQIWLGQKELVF